MKKTQFKDAIRNIQKQFVSFLSIVVIAMMAVVAYLGIVYSAEATVRSAESYFNAHRMWDIQITSTLLMGQEDLDAVRALDYVELAEPVQVFPAYLMAEGQKENVSLMSLSKELAAYDLTAGRPPETTQECMLEKSIADAYGYEVGSRIHLENETLAGIDPILQKDYVVSGLFIHPDHISPQVPLTPYILVLDACFDQETLDGQFSQMLVQVRGAPAERYGEVYQKLIDDVEALMRQLWQDYGPQSPTNRAFASAWAALMATRQNQALDVSKGPHELVLNCTDSADPAALLSGASDAALDVLAWLPAAQRPDGADLENLLAEKLAAKATDNKSAEKMIEKSLIPSIYEDLRAKV